MSKCKYTIQNTITLSFSSTFRYIYIYTFSSSSSGSSSRRATTFNSVRKYLSAPHRCQRIQCACTVTTLCSVMWGYLLLWLLLLFVLFFSVSGLLLRIMYYQVLYPEVCADSVLEYEYVGACTILADFWIIHRFSNAFPLACVSQTFFPSFFHCRLTFQAYIWIGVPHSMSQCHCMVFRIVFVSSPTPAKHWGVEDAT